MGIVLATQSDAEMVFDITQRTIHEIYPHYYPPSAVKFFSDHHSIENILSDISKNCVWILRDKNHSIGTVTINRNEINRLFVLPDYQGRGVGRRVMDFAEKHIFENFSYITLSSSFPAQEMYRKRGYEISGFHKIPCGNGDFFCYNEMILKSAV